MTLKEFVAQAMRVPFLSGGRDYEGWDCWGLVFCAYRDVFSLALPAYSADYDDALDSPTVAAAISANKAEDWKTVCGEPLPGDVALMRMSGVPVHVGLVLDRQRMLHTRRGPGTTIVPLKSSLTPNRLEGIYRHVERG